MKGIKCEVSVMGMGDRCSRRENCRNNSGHVPPMVFLQVSTSDDMGGKNYVMDKDGFPRTSLKKKGS